MISKANKETRKSVIKSIFQHIQELNTQPNDFQQNQSHQTILKKTIDILNCVSEQEDTDLELTNLCFQVLDSIATLYKEDE